MTLLFLLVVGIFADKASAQLDYYDVGDKVYGPVKAIAYDSVNSVLYAAGMMDAENYGKVNGIAQLKGEHWEPMGDSAAVAAGSMAVNALQMFNGKLLAGGAFVKARNATVHNMAVWDGTTWSSIGDVWDTASTQFGAKGKINTFLLHNNEVYVAGKFTKAGTTKANCIAKWDGSTWTDVSTGLTEFDEINCLAFYKDVLYAGTKNGLKKKAVGGWELVTADLTGNVAAMTVYAGKLVLSGNFDKIGAETVNRIAMWDGSSFTKMADGFADGREARTLFSKGNDLYAGGNFKNSGALDLYRVAKWDGTTWSQPKGGFNSEVLVIAPYKNTILFGGMFGQNRTTNKIISMLVSLDSIAKTTQGLSAASNIESLKVYPNPSSGQFTVQLPEQLQVATIRVHNSVGAVVYSASITAAQSQVDLSNFANGLYYAVISTKSTLYTNTLLKQ